MATVFLAHDVKHDRRVAVKILRPGVAESLGAERFLSEIRTTAKLQHPHILPLFDSGAAAGTLYYVMPYVAGESLRQRLSRERQLSVDDALRIGREVADALAYAHAQGVIHRDIKPENLLIADGHVLVADFGIARAVSAAANVRLTQAGSALGTPAYMSPEQATGDDVDGRSDLYSLACVVYEMLSGAPPFSGATFEAILLQRFTKPVPRVRGRMPDVSATVDAALHRAMARDPADRFATVDAFIGALAASAPAASPAGVSIAVLPFTNMSGPDDEFFSDGVTEEIINKLVQLPGLRVAARTSCFAFKGKHEDLRAVGEKLGVTTLLDGSVRRAGNRLRITAELIDVVQGYHIWSERYDSELTDVFAIQDSIASAIASKLKLTIAGGQPPGAKPATPNVEAYERYLKGRDAIRRRGTALHHAVVAYEQAIERAPEYAPALAGLAQSLALLSFWGYVTADSIRKRAVEAAARAVAVDPGLPQARTAAALTAMLLEFDREKAAAAWQRLDGLPGVHPDDRILRAVYHHVYVRGDSDTATRELSSLIADDPENAYAHAGIAVALSWAGRAREALLPARRAVELDSDALYANFTLAFAQALAGEYAELSATLPGVLVRFGRHPLLLMTLGIAANHAGAHDVAVAVHAELSARAQLEPIQHSILASTAIGAGLVAEAWGHLREAAAGRESSFAVLALHWPVFAPLRGTAEFNELLGRVGWFAVPPVTVSSA